MLMKRILLFASAALLFAGCAKENLIPTDENGNNSQKGDITLSFSASQAGFGTKAVIGETAGEGISKSTAINWQSTDQISVFDGANENCQFSTKGFNADAPSCTFEGNVTKPAIDYIAVYPYTESATISEGVISGISLPATQTAVEGSFDPKAALMAAKTVSGGRDLAFKNLVGYVKVTTDFECKQIELCAASGEKLAGAGTITFNNEGTPSFALGDGAVSSITLHPAGEGTHAAGTYYIAVPARTLAAGWNISFTATNDKVYSRQGTKPIQFKTNTVINLGTIKLDDLIPYVTFTAASEQTFTFSIPEKFTSALGANEYFEYSVGDGEWTQFKTTVDNIKFGGTLGSLRLRGKSSKGTALNSDSGCSKIEFTTENSPVDCTGDIRTLIDYENYADVSTKDAMFRSLFYKNKELKTAPKLPATTLASYCYYEMFSGCTALETAPVLPATTLAEACYTQMFDGCTALTKAPTLLAETLAFGCCDEMFGGCTALKTAPEELPATTLAGACYNKMFSGCIALETAPKLPAKTLAVGCYSEMFSGCTALTKAPELPAETLAPYCYQYMFKNCSALQSVRIKAKPVFDAQDEGNLSFQIMEYANCFDGWLDGAGSDNPKIYCYQEFYDFITVASKLELTLCPGWSFYDIDNTWSQWGQY